MWAHSRNEQGRRHELAAHLRSTAALARRFAEPFGAGDLAAALGLFHDAGKAACEWQSKLLKVEGTGGKVGINHKNLGAKLLHGVVGDVALAILGHHGGLHSREELEDEVDEGLSAKELRTAERLFELLPEARNVVDGPVLVPAAWRKDPFVLEMGLRLVFSALVDADHLDTAAHFSGLDAPQVAPVADMAELLRRFEAGRAAMLDDRPVTEVNQLRNWLYEEAVKKAAGPPGLYRLPAPTGSGKTLTAAAFALHHAAKYGKSRVIVAVPFITITEQNAQVYRQLLGDDVVLEHHSAVELDGRQGRLGAENWDASFVITTTVQLFDSLFGRMPARSRKVHRLANAVIVLDEVQSLPIPLLVPILDGLRLLTEHFNTTVLLASATQPAFEHLDVWRNQKITNVIDNPAPLYGQLQRVRYEWWLDPAPSLEEVATRVAEERQALVVVNTVRDARKMFRQLDELTSIPVRHLSARMCPAHRRAVLSEVRNMLGRDEPVLLVSTQLIEAGVDIDFPVVYRALAGADALQQAAGRANREGLRPDLGRCVVFNADGMGAPVSYRTPMDVTLECFGPGRADPDDLTALTEYYQQLYESLRTDNSERTTKIQECRAKLDFISVAEGPLRDMFNPAHRKSELAFRMLDAEEQTVPVVVSGFDAEAELLLDQLRSAEGRRRGLFRELQRFIVALPVRLLRRQDVQAFCQPVFEGDKLYEWRGDYHPQLGIDEDATVVATII